MLAGTWALRRERPAALRDDRSRVEDFRAPATLADATHGVESEPTPDSRRDALEAGAQDAVTERPLRVRVVDAEYRTTVRKCAVWLEFAGAYVGKAPELPDGSHEFSETIRPGTDVVV